MCPLKRLKWNQPLQLFTDFKQMFCVITNAKKPTTVRLAIEISVVYYVYE